MSSFRSPLPLLLAGILGALLLIAVVSLPLRSTPEGAGLPTLSDREALTMVAEKMRTGEASQQVLNSGQAHFSDGAWYVVVGPAHFHFTARNRVVVADDEAAQKLEFGGNLSR